MINESLLKSEERAIYRLRSLYTSYGYHPYKMSKFEEYDLYVRNKDFLVSDRVITFNDTDGRLLALKPDVTLSIIKNTVKDPCKKQKVYYNENVYRVSQSTGQFKEIMQTGLECIGDIDFVDIFEVVTLAIRSLAEVSENYVLDISHMGIISAILAESGCSSIVRRNITKLIAEKNSHELGAVCFDAGLPTDVTEKLLAITGMYGDRATVLEKLVPICTTVEERLALNELVSLNELLTSWGAGDNVRFDFSVVNNMSYYNGIVFKGFLLGIAEGVLAGGVYNKLLSSMRLDSRGIGFALYLDLLEALESEGDEYDVDVYLRYSESTDPVTVISKKKELISQGKRVYSSSVKTESVRYRELVEI